MSICVWEWPKNLLTQVFRLIRWTECGPEIGNIQPLLAETLEPTQIIFIWNPLAPFYQESILSPGKAQCVIVRRL